MEREPGQDPEHDGPAGPQPGDGSPGPNDAGFPNDADSPGASGSGTASTGASGSAAGASGADAETGGDEESVFGPWDRLEGTLGAAKEREELLSGFAPGGVWDKHPPGPELAAAVARAAGPDWRCAVAAGEELIGLLRAMAALQSWAGAGLLGVIRAVIRDDDLEYLGRPRHGDLPDEWDDSLVHEISLALAVSAPSAAKTTRAAWELAARLPGVELLLKDGTLDLPRARLVAEVFEDLSDENCAKAEELLLPELTALPRKTYTQIERIATAIAAAVDPDLAERRRKATEKHRARVQMFREQAGTAALSGRDLPTDQTLAAFAKVAARAGQYKESGVFPGKRIDRLRATAYLDILNGVTADDRIAYGRLSPDDADDADADTDADDADTDADADADADADDADADADADTDYADDGPGAPAAGDDPGSGQPGAPGPFPGGSDCLCRECDGRCAPPTEDTPDDDEPDDDFPDEDLSGGDEPGGDEPGGDEPGGDEPGGDGDRGGSDSPAGGRPGGGPGGGPRAGDSEPPDNEPGGNGEPGRGQPPAVDRQRSGPGRSDARGGGSDGPGRGVRPSAGGPPPTLTDLVFPLATLLGLAERPGEGHGLGTIDPALCRVLAATSALSPHTTVCVTVTDSDGIAIGHGCVKTGRIARPPGGPPPPLVALPARMNLTITTAGLAELRMQSEAQPPGQRETGWAIARRGAGPPGDPDWCGPWALALPSGLEYAVHIEPVPTYDCDHRNESHTYKPNARLRHLVQIRDYSCTFPSCSRHARESDFEHAVPYDQGGRTCACNAGARSRKCHRVKQSRGWNVTQPKPGWHQWTTPRGRTYTQGPQRYPV